MKQRIFGAIVACVLCSVHAHAQSTPNGQLLSTGAYSWPELTHLTSEQQRNLHSYYTDSAYAAALQTVDRARFALLDVWYSSEDLRVRAYVFKPVATPH